jgi:hypothetical protein
MVLASVVRTVHTSGINWESLGVILGALAANVTACLASIQQLRHKLNGHIQQHVNGQEKNK